MPEEEAFCVFVKLMQDYRLRELFKPSMAELGLCMYQFEFMIQVKPSYRYQELQFGSDRGRANVSPLFSPLRNNYQSCTCTSRLRAFTPPCMRPPGFSLFSSHPFLCPLPQGYLTSSCVRLVERIFANKSIVGLLWNVYILTHSV